MICGSINLCLVSTSNIRNPREQNGSTRPVPFRNYPNRVTAVFVNSKQSVAVFQNVLVGLLILITGIACCPLLCGIRAALSWRPHKHPICAPIAINVAIETRLFESLKICIGIHTRVYCRNNDRSSKFKFWLHSHCPPFSSAILSANLPTRWVTHIDCKYAEIPVSSRTSQW